MPPIPQRTRHQRRAVRALAGAVVALLARAPTACTERGLLAPPTLEPLLVHVDGAWLRDAKRRVVLLRGANYLASPADAAREERRAPRVEDFAFLAGLGFNLIRLPISWAALEPRPSAWDYAYLRDGVDPLLRESSNHGMQVVLALHQVRWSSCFLGGSGAPTWTCAGAVVGGGQGPGWGQRDAIADARAARAQCGFYRAAKAPDGHVLREHYTEAWHRLAAYYDQDKRILGFDLLNEPSPGSCFPAATFVTEVIAPYYAQLRDSVREAGAPQALLYQPAVARDATIGGAPAAMGSGAIFAPHLFSQAFGAPAAEDDGIRDPALAASYEQAAELARQVGGPLLVGEIGADAPPEGAFRAATPEFLQASLDELDRRLIGGAVWAFVPHPDGIPASGGIGIGNEADAALLARPFARRIAGIPEAMRFDPASREFSFRFRDDPDARPPDPTEIFLPAKRRYPDGFAVEVTAGDTWKFDERNQRLLLYRGAATTHEVHVTARRAAAGTAH